MTFLEQTLKPKVVIMAPDGQSLWIDPLAQSEAPSLLQGFGVTARMGDVPTDDPTVTTSPLQFALREGLTFALSAGPLGLPWFVWLGLTVYGVAQSPKWFR